MFFYICIQKYSSPEVKDSQHRRWLVRSNKIKGFSQVLMQLPPMGRRLKVLSVYKVQ